MAPSNAVDGSADAHESGHERVLQRTDARAALQALKAIVQKISPVAKRPRGGNSGDGDGEGDGEGGGEGGRENESERECLRGGQLWPCLLPHTLPHHRPTVPAQHLTISPPYDQ